MYSLSLSGNDKNHSLDMNAYQYTHIRFLYTGFIYLIFSNCKTFYWAALQKSALLIFLPKLNLDLDLSTLRMNTCYINNSHAHINAYTHTYTSKYIVCMYARTIDIIYLSRAFFNRSFAKSS